MGCYLCTPQKASPVFHTRLCPLSCKTSLRCKQWSLSCLPVQLRETFLLPMPFRGGSFLFARFLNISTLYNVRTQKTHQNVPTDCTAESTRNWWKKHEKDKTSEERYENWRVIQIYFDHERSVFETFCAFTSGIAPGTLIVNHSPPPFARNRRDSYYCCAARHRHADWMKTVDCAVDSTKTVVSSRCL